MAYTYDDFEKAAKDSGFYNQFTAADLNLAKTNPDAGMSLLSAKREWNSATTDDQRALAHSEANNIRLQYGGYSGGATGSDVVLASANPSGNYKTGYISPYKSQIESLLSGINNDSFTYDAETDPVAQSYKKTFTREGERATRDALGTAAAATGGIPSTFATTAATQAGQYYGAQLADKTAELENNAYNRFMTKKSADLAILDALDGLDTSEYNRYATDRDYDYTKELNERQLTQANLENEAKLLSTVGDYSYYKKLFPDLTDAQIKTLANTAMAKKPASGYTPTVPVAPDPQPGDDGDGTPNTVASFDQARGEVYALISQGKSKDDILSQIQQAYEAEAISSADLQKYKTAISSVRA